MFENIQSTYNTYFAGAERPPVPDYMPCTTSFKLLAEVPIQRKAHPHLNQISCLKDAHIMRIETGCLPFPSLHYLQRCGDRPSCCCAVMFLINLYSRTVTARIPSLVPILVQGAVLAGDTHDPKADPTVETRVIYVVDREQDAAPTC